MIVAFSGLAGSGKDTSADYLVEHHDFVKVAFADEMKRTCARIFPKMTREHLWGSSSKRNEPLPDYPRKHGPWVHDSDGHRCACCNIFEIGGGAERRQCFLTTRFALQQLGTEWGRTCFENTWVDFTLEVATSLLRRSGILRSLHFSYTPWDGLLTSNVPVGPKPQGVVISDMRWPAGNEGTAIRAWGGKLLKLKRGEGLAGAAGAHSSEQAMAGVPESHFDHVIDNREYTLKQLYAQLSDLATNHLSGKKKT